MSRATPEDHALMSLAIKRAERFVDLLHIQEKISRDAGRKFSKEETAQFLESLVKKGLLTENAGEYAISDQGREYFEKRWRLIRQDLNQDYLKVYRAKRYYPLVAEVLLEFCRDRWVSVFRLFTGRAWLQRKQGPRYITIKSWKDIEKWLDVHGIDFIPYLHRVGSDRPDWLVIDLDAGKEVVLEETKKVVLTAREVLIDYGVEPAIKFSGSRGFQIWARFKTHELPSDYRPKQLKSERRERSYFGFYADIIRFVESRVAEKLPGLTTSETAKKEERARKVLFDASIIKPMGDVRAPYSMHYNTGFISMPLTVKDLVKFDPAEADPDRVVERYRERGNEFLLKECDGKDLFRDTVEWCRL
ncbi:MAG: non-homologous end-joining DNA ligase LigD [Candidatus Hadarchaeaceae archaeon]